MMKCTLYQLFILLNLGVLSCEAWYNVVVDSLNSNNWTLVNSNHSINISATVPGNVYTALLRHSILKDPYYRFNDDAYKWVAKDAWTYSTYINTMQGKSEYENIDLVFYGLDTVASIKLNGETVAETDNMFQKYVVPIRKHLQPGTCKLEVAFKSPLDAAKDNADAYPYSVPPECPVAAQNGDCHVNFLRKEQASFSWDWGPSFPTVGVWKDVKLQFYHSAIISEVTTETQPVTQGDISGDWRVTGKVFFDVGVDTSREIKGELVIDIAGVFAHYYEMVTLTTEKNYCEYTLKVDKKFVQLWWPNGHGSRTLYDMMVNFTSSDYGSEQSLYNLQIGFRTIQLVQEPVSDSNGLSFYFRVNNKPIFMKGSNWIPADSFQDRITDDYVRELLTSAADAHMNMLRVWGGGVYESEVFYKTADELGILIWQDMMFACALYPSDENFLETVTKEVTYQLRRLQHHPSVAVWAGNNENEGALMGPWWNLHGLEATYKKDYIKLYIDTIQRVVTTEDGSRPFVSSSPSNGLQTQREGWLSKNVQDTHYGDVHYYNYVSDNWDYKNYPTPRFASEYGFQSWCSLEALASVSLPSDLTMDSNFSAHRQHHGNGNSQMLIEFEMHMRKPSSTDPQQFFRDYVFLTQINQAMAIKTESEHYLRMQSHVTGGEGMTMGALYWQLNDIWQAPTWASIEFGGKWKMLHYYARDFFRPVILSPYFDRANKTVRLHLINDSLPIMPHLETYHPPGSLVSESGPDDKSGGKDCDNKFSNCKTDSNLRFVPDESRYDSVKRLSRNVRSVKVSKGGVTHIERGTEPCMPLLPTTVVINMYNWNSSEPAKTWNVTVKELSVASTVVFSETIILLLNESACPTVDHCFLHFSLPACHITNWLFLGYPRDAKGMCPKNGQLMVKSVTLETPSEVKVVVWSDFVVPFVWLESEGHRGVFSSNGFLMVSKLQEVMYYPREPMTTSQFNDFKKTLTVTSLCDVK